MHHAPVIATALHRRLVLLVVLALAATSALVVTQAALTPALAVGATVVDQPTLLHGNGARLTWRRSADADFVRYEVHRSTSAGFVASDATKLVEIGYQPLTMFTDTTAKGATTYYYKVVTVTGAGSAASEVTADLPAAGTSRLVVDATPADVAGTSIGNASSTSTASCLDDTNWGGSGNLYVGSDTTDWILRGLLRFDLRDIPANASVSSATMTLNYLPTSTTDTGVQAYRLNQGWDEGRNDGACAGGTGATWKESRPGVTWRTKTGAATGGPVVGAAIAPNEGTHARTTLGADTFALTPMVQAWANGAPNHGLLLRQSTESRTTASRVTYHSDDSTAVALRPRLVVAWADASKVSTGSFDIATTSPVAAQTVSGTTTLGANVSAASGPVSVKYFIGANQVGAADTTPPFTYAWNSATVADGASTVFRAEVTNAAGQAKSSSVTFAVDNSPAPTNVAILSPANGATVSGPQTVTATAADDKGIRDLTLMVNGTAVARDAAAPWSMVWDTRDAVMPGYRENKYDLKVVARDTSGRLTGSAVRSVYVNNDNSASQLYRASFSLNGYGTTTEAFPLPPMIDSVQQVTTTSADSTSGGDGNVGAKGAKLSSEPTCDACASGTTTSGSTALTTEGRSGGGTTSLAGVIERPIVDDGSSVDTSAGGGGSTTNPKPLAAGSFRADVAVTNTSPVPWKSGGPGGVGLQLWYRWYTDDGTVVYEAPGNSYFPNNLKSGATSTIPVLVRQPPLLAGAQRDRLRLRFDIYDSSVGTWFADRGNQPIDQPVIVNHGLAGNLGLERFWQYEQVPTGAGSSAFVNVANGNLIWRHSPSATPGRGISTIVDLTYNSLEEHSDSPAGENVSLNISGLLRFGSRLDIHPNKADTLNGNARRYVRFIDGDGTLHEFTGAVDASGTVRWTEPAGVNLYLNSYPNTADPKRYWRLTRPDGVTYWFDSEGYPRLVQDRNDNVLEFVLADVEAGQDPGGPKRRVAQIVDPGGSKYTVDYFEKDEVKGGRVRGNVQALVDNSGSKMLFDYYDDGNLRALTQTGGVSAEGVAVADRTMYLTYTNPKGDAPAIATAAARKDPAPDTVQSVKLYSVVDHLGNETQFSYWGPTPDSKNRWKLKTWTDREGNATSFAYDWVNRVTTSNAPLDRDTDYGYDTQGRVTRIVDAREDTTRVDWTTDNKVARVTFPTSRTQTFDYDPNGYATRITNEAGEVDVLDYHRLPVDSNDSGGHLGFIKSRTLPKGNLTPGTPDDYMWTFGIDARGNTTTVTDPEGTRTGTVGDYTSTYVYGAPGSATAGLVTSAKKPEGGTSTYDYNPCGLMTRATDAVGAVTTFGYDLDCRTIWQQDAEHQAYSGGDPRTYRTTFDLDEFGRVVRTSTPYSTKTMRGRMVWSGSAYDANDNVTRDLVPSFGGVSGAPDVSTGTGTAVRYDRMDRPVLVTGPDKTADPQGERTRIVYDAAGRTVSTTLPKGIDTAAQDHESATAYDVLDRPVSSTQYGTSATDVRRTFSCYDLAGDMVATVGARAQRDNVDCGALGSVDFVTQYQYDVAHRLLKVTDPEGRVSTSAYDANGDVELATRRIAGGTTPRLHRTAFAYDQRGLRTRTTESFSSRDLVTVMRYDQDGRRTLEASPRAVDADAGAGTYADFATRTEYDAAGQVVRTLLPKQGSGEQHYVHQAYDKLGRLAWQSLPTVTSTPGAVTALAKTSNTYFDTGAIRTLDKNATPALLFDYDALGMQTSRVPAKRGTANDWDYGKRVTWSYSVDGQRLTQTERDGGQMWWKYDAHNLLVDSRDGSGVDAGWDGAVTTKASYNGFDEPTKVRSRKDSNADWDFSTYSYNDAGMPSVVLAGGTETEAGTQVSAPRRIEYSYDKSDFITGQLNLGSTAGCVGDERLAMTYTDTGWESSRTLWRGGDACTADSASWRKRQTTTWEQFDNGKLKSVVTKNGDGAVTESHDVTYTTAGGRYEDGNRVVDRYVLKRQDGAAASDCTVAAPCDHKFTYDPRGKVLVDEIKADNVVRYTLDEPAMLRGDDTIRNGDVTTQVKLGTTTKQYYQGGQQVEATATKAGASTTSKFWYDEYGNQDCVTTGAGSAANCNGPKGSANANVTQEFTYDDTNRLLAQAKYTGGGAPTDSSQYVNDALDRVIQETEEHKVAGKSRTTDFSFFGLTKQVAQEVQTGGDDADLRTKTYTYNTQGQRLTMSDQKTGSADSTQVNYSYAVDVHGSVSQLLGEDGKVKASYGYDAYGNADTEDTGTGSATSLTTGDKDDQDPLNPYRYTGRRLDSGTAGDGTNATSLDMGARRFGLDTGRFLQEDMFLSSLGDLGLSMDPLSGNRYALAGGNPVSAVEIDGHMLMADGGGGSTSSGGTSTSSTGGESTSGTSTPYNDWSQYSSGGTPYQLASGGGTAVTSGASSSDDGDNPVVGFFKDTVEDIKGIPGGIEDLIIGTGAGIASGSTSFDSGSKEVLGDIASERTEEGWQATGDGALALSMFVPVGGGTGAGASWLSRIGRGALRTGGLKALSAPSSKALAANLVASGVKRPAQSAAHHIVAGSSPKAAEARSVIQKYGVDINDVENGVFLPSNAKSANPTGAAVHSKIHTNAYYDEVNSMLGQARSKSDVIDSLDYIRTQLQSGGFP